MSDTALGMFVIATGLVVLGGICLLAYEAEQPRSRPGRALAATAVALAALLAMMIATALA